MKYFSRIIFPLALLFLFACEDSHEEEIEGLTWEKNIFPCSEWNVANPDKYGYDPLMGNEIEEYINDEMTTTGLIVVVGGEIIYSYGDVTELSYLASCRKSILSMMYGKYVENGTIELDWTMNDLGIDDIGGLLNIEKTASIRNCITARSGVYHEASNSGDDSEYAPERGSKTPGEYYLYNNWDFNVAGTIFEQLVGGNIYEVFQSDIAEPLQMQDFVLSKQKKGGDLTISKFPAYHFYLSTRDMARIGYLMLRNGKWDGTQVVSSDWVETITNAYTEVGDMNPQYRKTGSFGYGYMWWVWDGNSNINAFKNAFTAWGAGGQFITVLPALDMVVAHKTSSNDNSSDNYWQLLRIITKTQLNEYYFE